MDEQDKHDKSEIKKIRTARFQREELWGLISRAELMAGVVPNPRYARAYADVAQSLSTLDAFIARSKISMEDGETVVRSGQRAPPPADRRQNTTELVGESIKKQASWA